MKFNATLFLSALGLACVLESLPWLLAPRKMKEALIRLIQLPAGSMRYWGVFLMLTGLLLVWLGR